MDFELAFPLNIVGIFLAFGLLVRQYIWPWLRTLPQDRTLKILMLEASDPERIKVPSETSGAALGRLWAVDHRKPPDTSGHYRAASPLIITGYSPSSVVNLSS